MHCKVSNLKDFLIQTGKQLGKQTLFSHKSPHWSNCANQTKRKKKVGTFIVFIVYSTCHQSLPSLPLTLWVHKQTNLRKKNIWLLGNGLVLTCRYLIKSISLSIITRKSKNMIIRCPEFPIECTITYLCEKSQIVRNSTDNYLPEGSEKVGRDYILLCRIHMPTRENA